MNIWFEFEGGLLKTLLSTVHTRKNVSPLMGGENVLGSRPWSDEYLVWILQKQIHRELRAVEHKQDKRLCSYEALSYKV